MTKKDTIQLARKIKNYCDSIQEKNEENCYKKCDKKISTYCGNVSIGFGAETIESITKLIYSQIDLLNAIEFINNHDDKNDELLNIVSQNYKSFNQFDVKNNIKSADMGIGKKIKDYCKNHVGLISCTRCHNLIMSLCLHHEKNFYYEKSHKKIEDYFNSDNHLLNENQKNEVIKLLGEKNDNK